MEAEPSPTAQLAPRPRARHRHELRTLTYVTLDQANGGIVRNLSHDGIAVQAVAAVRPRQQVRVRFELRYPRLRVETCGEVVWSTFSGQCGIRFRDMPPRLIRQIDEWIFGDLLQGLSIPWDHAGSVYVDAASSIAAKSISSPSPSPVPSTPAGSITARLMEETQAPQFTVVEKAPAQSTLKARLNMAATPAPNPRLDPNPSSQPAFEQEQVSEGEADEDDGLIVSPAPVKVIELRPPAEPVKVTLPVPLEEPEPATDEAFPTAVSARGRVELDWLSQPLSGRSLAWTVNVLVVLAAVLLFAFVFLSVTREAPRWPFTMGVITAVVIGGLYWGFFRMFGGLSLGARLARLSGRQTADDEQARFR